MLVLKTCTDKLKIPIILLIVIFFISGCACNQSRKDGFWKGAFIGALTGIAAGAVETNHSDDNDADDVYIGMGIGALAGGLIGSFVNQCKEEPLRVAQVDTDTDGDGVVDRLDQCPDTPAGEPVDYKGCPKDSDGDGVYDSIDKCSNTPKNARVNSEGCPLDSDGDGIYDYLDNCPGTPAGARVDNHGCPLDTDGDGVADYLDKCQDTPMGSKVDEKGCPVAGEKLLILKGIKFELNSARIAKESEAILDVAIKTLLDNPSIKTKIEGHTCNLGTEEYNLGLSTKRAKSVKDYLVSKGIDAERLSIEGKGEGYPITSNSTEEGRKQNRRVEFIVLK